MIETLFVSFLAIPLCPKSPIRVWLLNLLLFKILIHSGLSKFIPLDSIWRMGTFFDTYFQNIPHPSPLAYWLHFFPFKSFFIVGTAITELITPLFILLPYPKFRKVAFIGTICLQGMIIASSNFATLNYNTLLLSILLLSKINYPTLEDLKRFKPIHMLKNSLIILYCGVSIMYTLSFFIPVSSPLIDKGLTLLAPFRTINRFMLFPETPAKLPQQEFEGSNDDGQTWKTYSYYHQPMSQDSKLSWFAPHNARFETVLAYRRDHPLALYTAEQLLRGNPLITRMFKHNPFATPPDMIRINTYSYTFSNASKTRWEKQKHLDYVHFFLRSPDTHNVLYQKLYY